MSAAAASIDLLCLAAHTDDAEIGCGAVLHLLAERGRRVWVCDLTRGELATNATPAERWQEAEAASAVLGLAGRIQLDLPDGFLAPHDPCHVGPVVAILRRLRPRWVVASPDPTRHPDHVALPRLLARAGFLTRLAAYRPPAPPGRWWPAPPASEATATWIPEALLEVCPDDGVPSMIFDVSHAWPAKQRALACYASQFTRGDSRAATYINSAAFSELIERRGRVWGARAGVAYGEALRTLAVPVFDDLPRERWA